MMAASRVLAGVIAAALACAMPQDVLAEGAGTVRAAPTASETAYADARRACARQGMRVRLSATQTNDKLLLTEGVTVGFQCVGSAAAARAKPGAAARRPPAKRPRPRPS